jgi:predicted dinucleotide-binding enzyme
MRSGVDPEYTPRTLVETNVHPRKETDMKIAVVGRGNVGGGLADRWERAGHSVTRIGKEGGDVSDADAVLVAVPGGAVADALDSVRGLDGKTTIDATNLFGVDPPRRLRLERGVRQVEDRRPDREVV